MLWFRIRLDNSSSETRTPHSHLRWSPHGTCLSRVGRGVSARCAAAFAPLESTPSSASRARRSSRQRGLRWSPPFGIIPRLD